MNTGPVVLGYGPMDLVHAEFDRIVAAAQCCPDGELAVHLEHVIAHLCEHFESEDSWMRESDFPPRDCHMDEHAAVLRSAGDVRELVRQGRLDVGRSFVDELVRWFPGHADYLDSALAAWLCKRAHGGKPVVLHRRKPTGVPERSIGAGPANH